MGDIYQVQMDINVEANKTVVLALRQPHWAPNHVVLADSRNVWPDLPKSA
jgi:hypothetical protein